MAPRAICAGSRQSLFLIKYRQYIGCDKQTHRQPVLIKFCFPQSLKIMSLSKYVHITYVSILQKYTYGNFDLRLLLRDDVSRGCPALAKLYMLHFFTCFYHLTPFRLILNRVSNYSLSNLRSLLIFGK